MVHTPSFLAMTTVSVLLLGSASAPAADYYPDATFTGSYGGELNISVFVFRDLNRNSRYDLGDRPLAGVAVEMVGGGRTQTAHSNINGFANFRMSATQSDMEVTSPGTYRFEVFAPPGMLITTDNAVQASTFANMPAAPADMISVTPPFPVGVAPDLTVSGTLATGDTAIDVRGPGGASASVMAADDGSFSFHAEPGTWTLSYPDGGTTATRTVEVVDAPIALGSVRPDDTALRGRPRIATFDDLDITSVLKVPSGYQGVDWLNFVGVEQEYYGGEGYVNDAHSGRVVAYGGSGHPAYISSSSPFDFNGGYFSIAWPIAQGETLNVRAWRGDNIALEDELTLSAFKSIYFDAKYNNITKLEFFTSHYWQFVADDLSITLDR